jgi:hypothetical protein
MSEKVKEQLIINKILREMYNEKRKKDFINIDTDDLVNELCDRVKSEVFIYCQWCSDEDANPYFLLTDNFKLLCKEPFCEKHTSLFIQENPSFISK